MILVYFLKIVFTIIYTYFVYTFFDKKIYYSLALIFLTFIVAHQISGILALFLLPLYFIIKKLIQKEKIHKFILPVFYILFIINTLNLPLKFLLKKSEFEIILKICAVFFWLSALVLFYEIKNNIITKKSQQTTKHLEKAILNKTMHTPTEAKKENQSK